MHLGALTLQAAEAIILHNLLLLSKVLSILEACFDLILSPSLSMKIQIMGGKITENLGFKFPLRKVNNALQKAHKSIVGAAHQRLQKKCKCFFICFSAAG